MYIVLSMISCSDTTSKDTQPTDTETTHTGHTGTEVEPEPKWVGLDLGPDGLCLTAKDYSYLCIGHDGVEYRYSIIQADHMSVGTGYGCALNGGVPVCTDALREATPTYPGGYNDLQTGDTFACGFQSPYVTMDCWGTAVPAHDADFMDSADLFSVGETVLCGARSESTPRVECYSQDGEASIPFQPTNKVLGVTAGDNRVCVLYENEGYSWGMCWLLSDTNLPINVDINGLYDPLLIRAASDDSLLCGLDDDGSVKCSDLIDVPPTGRFTFPARSSPVREFDAHNGVACVLYEDGKVTCLGLDSSSSQIASYSAYFVP